MKELITQTWKIKGDDSDVKVNFDRIGNKVYTEIIQGKHILALDEEQVQDLIEILNSTKFIFKQ